MLWKVSVVLTISVAWLATPAAHAGAADIETYKACLNSERDKAVNDCVKNSSSGADGQIDNFSSLYASCQNSYSADEVNTRCLKLSGMDSRSLSKAPEPDILKPNPGTGSRGTAPLPPKRSTAISSVAPARAMTPTAPTSKTAARTTSNQGPSKSTDEQATPAPDAATNGESVETAQTHAQADIATCTDLNNEASKCCTSPANCISGLSTDDKRNAASLLQMTSAGPTPGQSLPEYCAQLQSASAKSGSVNNGLAAICTSDYTSCQKTCNKLADKYQGLIDGCEDKNCAAESTYEDTLSALQSSASACGDFQSMSSKLVAQGLSTASNQSYGSVCQSVTGAQTAANGTGSGAGGGAFGSASAQAAAGGPSNPMNDPYGCQANSNSLACQDCKKNPDGASCRGLAQTAQVNQTDAGFASGSSKSSGLSGYNPLPSPVVSGAANIPTTDVTAGGGVKGTVANNSGGAIPGTTGGGGASVASLGAARGPSPGSPGFSTDIEQGMRSGGGYSQPAGGGSGDDAGRGGAAGRHVASQDAGGGFFGMDLRQFLPGGRRDPGRQLAGLDAANLEIGGKGVDMFKKISVKMEEKCKLGVLWQCAP